MSSEVCIWQTLGLVVSFCSLSIYFNFGFYSLAFRTRNILPCSDRALWSSSKNVRVRSDLIPCYPETKVSNWTRTWNVPTAIPAAKRLLTVRCFALFLTLPFSLFSEFTLQQRQQFASRSFLSFQKLPQNRDPISFSAWPNPCFVFANGPSSLCLRTLSKHWAWTRQEEEWAQHWHHLTGGLL